MSVDMKGASELQKNNTVLQIDLTEQANDIVNSAGRPITFTQTEFDNQKISIGISNKASSGAQVNYPAWVTMDKKMAM
jgi:hypothetical protein